LAALILIIRIFLKLAKFTYSNCKPNSRPTKARRKSKEKQGTMQFSNGLKRTAYASTALSEFLNVIIEFQQSEVYISRYLTVQNIN
jgi:hypothetical protein